MENEEVYQYLKRIEFERVELQEDLLGLSFDVSGCKVGDFGCGWGYTTWSLLLEIPKSICIGVDKFDPEFLPEPEDYFSNKRFSIDIVQNGSTPINRGG